MFSLDSSNNECIRKVFIGIDIDSLKAQVATLTQTVDNLRQECDEYAKDACEMADQLHATQRVSAEEKRNLEDENRDLRLQVAEAVSGAEDLKAEYNDTCTHVQAQSDQISRLQERLAGSRSLVSQLRYVSTL